MRPAKRTITSAAVLTAALVTAAAAAPATGAGSGPAGSRVLADGVGQPYQIALRHGTVYYADGAAGTINKITRTGPRVVRSVPAVSGVEFSRDGRTMAYAHGGGDPTGPPARVTLVRHGKGPTVAKIDDYENRVNPDRDLTYGITTGPSAACEKEVTTPQEGQPPETVTPATYQGIKDSHPYQLAPLHGGAFALADAGVNAVLRVGPWGHVSTIAVLPPQPVRLTAQQATAMGIPSCAGETYAFESVPTDVEVAGGALWVTTLPGGPESPLLGARGAVYRIKHGHVRKVASGFLGATNLGVAGGRAYVTEFFAGKLTQLGWRGRSTRAELPGVVSVEATPKYLYVGTFGMGPDAPGQVLRLRR